jgi:hypothetical protein
MKLGDFLNSINYDKKSLLDQDEKAEKLYTPFIVNKCLSYFPDTIFHVNEVNCNWHLEKKMQFDFLRHGIRKKKRFSPWVKKEIQDDVEIIKQVYGYTDAKAQEVLNILGPGDMDLLKKSLEKGGIDNKD